MVRRAGLSSVMSKCKMRILKLKVCGSHVLWERSSIYQHIYQVSNHSKSASCSDPIPQVHNRMTMEEYGRLMVNYKDAPAEQQQKQTRQMSYVESNIDWWVSTVKN